MTKTLSLLALLTLLGCGSGSDETTTTETTGEEAPVETSVDTDEAPAETTEAAALSVTRISGSDSAPATAYENPAPSVTLSMDGDAIQASVANFVFYCEPPPTFSVRMEGEVVVLQAETPEGDVTRCVGPHYAVLRIEGAPAGATVSLRNTSGEEVANSAQ